MTDSGLARIQSDPGLTASTDMLGTLRYMSPTISTNGDPADTPIASYVQESGGHIAQFTFVPEPQTGMLFVLVLLATFGRFRRS